MSRVWKDNVRRFQERIDLFDVLNTYSSDYKVIIVGDAAMSPFEIAQPGGSVEHWNDEPGAIWLKRLLKVYSKAVWLNPEPEDSWKHTMSTQMTLELMENRMYPLTINGLENAMNCLAK